MKKEITRQMLTDSIFSAYRGTVTNCEAWGEFQKELNKRFPSPDSIVSIQFAKQWRLRFGLHPL